MTDEEFGRAWAKQQSKSPQKAFAYWWWHVTPYGPPEHYLPTPVFAEMTNRVRGIESNHDTESAAYAALGRAVRAVHAAVPILTPGK